LKISGCNSNAVISSSPPTLNVFGPDIFSVRSTVSAYGYFNPVTDALYIKGTGTQNIVENGDLRIHHASLGTNVAVSCGADSDCGLELTSMRDQKSTARVKHASKKH